MLRAHGNAPDAGQGIEGQTPKEGTQMNTTIIAQQVIESERRQAEWLAAHADDIAAAQPAWADSTRTEVDFDDDDGTVESIMFSRRVGTVAIEQMFFPGNRFGTPYPAGEPQVWEDDNGPKPIGQATIIGTDLIKAAQILNGPGEVSVSMFEIVGDALGISGTDLYTLAHVEKDPEEVVTMGDLFRMSRYVGMSPVELYNLASRKTPDDFDVTTAEEEAYLGRDAETGEPLAIILEHESQGGLSPDGARALARRLNALADEWEKSRPLRRLRAVEEDLRGLDG